MACSDFMKFSKGKLILGDQLNENHPWFQEVDEYNLFIMMEVRSETDYAHHHIQKLVGFFAAMRRFAKKLEDNGHSVFYLKLNDRRNKQSFTENLRWIAHEKDFSYISYMLPDEWRLDRELGKLDKALNIPTEAVDTHHFLTTRNELADFFEGKKTLLMESFYRHMRRRYDLLMDGDKPVKGKWNYDKQNRKSLPKDHQSPAPKTFGHDVADIKEMIDNQRVDYFGEIDSSNFPWPLSREEGLEVLEYFCKELLPHFGDYQDAITGDDANLYHSRLSFALNTKMLNPLEVCQRVIGEWESRKGEIDISQVEGFVRQILGWREFMRGVYWKEMPGYAKKNFFNHRRKLPGWFWTGETKMACLKDAIGKSLKNAYAHHIQRLMITGNFSLLATIDPNEVDAWYLGVYIDAIEWVEITNTRGMSQFADGGIVGTKPYVSSANYIDKMGDFCKDCFYSKSKKTGEKACPFNSLYWNFYDRHRDKLENNPRIGFVYQTLDKMDGKKKEELIKQADYYLNNLDEL